MKTFALAAIAGAASALLTEEDFHFMHFVAKFNKFYDTTEEYKLRQNEWANKDAIIKAHNQDSTQTHTLGHNYMSDWTHDEYKVLLGYKPEADRPYNPMPYVKSNSSGINWVEKGAVTKVKNQGSCGSCWSFSTTGALEGAHQIATGNLVSYSEEQLVQCDYGILKNMGCNGGLMDKAFKYVEGNALATEADYPYTSGKGVRGSCDSSKYSNASLKVSSYYDVAKNDSDALKAALDKGPVSVAIEADKAAFQQYTSGVITGSACGTNLDHGVLAVGYGTENGTEYFLVKNSWAASWGDQGYVKIGVESGAGVCGIQSGPPSQPSTN
jgi:C1A family cysteine protease